MRLLPTTREDRLRLALFPFKAYILLVPIVVVVVLIVSKAVGWNESVSGSYRAQDVARARAEWFSVCEYGYVVSIVGLIVGANHVTENKARRSAIIFAILGLVLDLTLHPAMQVAKTRTFVSEPNSPAAANSAIALASQTGDQGRGVAGRDC